MHVSPGKAGAAHGVGLSVKADLICLSSLAGMLDVVATFLAILFRLLNSEFS